MVDTYFPTTWDEALEIRSRTNILVYAGGTDLMVKNKREAPLLPSFNQPVMFIGKLPELQHIQVKNNKIVIGAGCTYDIILRSKEIPEILKQAIKEIASPAIRNIGTLAGNICNASPAGDTLPVLYALDAVLQLVSKESSREVPIEEFILGPRKTVLQQHEILKGVHFSTPHFTGQYYKKVGARKADAISKLSFVGLINLKENVIQDLRITFGAVAPTVVRSKEVEKKLIGMSVQDIKTNIDAVIEKYNYLITPIDDQRSTAFYRKTVSLRLLSNFLDFLP